MSLYAVYARYIVEAADEAEAIYMVCGADVANGPEIDDAWVEAEYEI